MKRRLVYARVRHHLVAAMRDAWRLRSNAPGTRELRAAVGKPGFCLGLIASGLAIIAVSSGGLAIKRAMLVQSYPDGGRLVLISETGVPLVEHHPISRSLLDFWRIHTTTLAGLAGYQWDSHGTAWVTPEFFEVLGARPRRFLLHAVRN